MLKSQREALTSHIRAAVAALGAPVDSLVITLERPRQAAHGDLATNVAMQLAKPLRSNPRAVAERLVDHLKAHAGDLIERADIAGPGFVNLHLTPAVRQRVLVDILSDPEGFGLPAVARQGQAHDPLTPLAPLMIEFVSANPTGPLHVGHGRQAALGDVLANVLEATGQPVSREFYYNDAGAQINNLALSVQARARGIPPDDPTFPTDGYRGDYIAELARAYLARETVQAEQLPPVTANGDPEDLDAIHRFAVTAMRREQDQDLKSFGVRFDRYYLESSLYSDGLVDKTVAALKASGHAYEADGALWLRSTDFGDDKDRVMRKSDGSYTYFVPDVAYHTTKWARGFRRVINIQGSDHHGTVARVRAGLQALAIDIPPGYPDYVLHKMVKVVRGGEEVKLSKRAGSYVTLRDLIDWSGDGDPVRGRDAVRFFLVSRKADTEFVFDVDLARKNTDENPVHYVQYAHARICSVLANADAGVNPGAGADPGAGGPAAPAAAATATVTAAVSAERFQPLVAPTETALLARLAAFEEALDTVVADLSPHHLCYYLRDLAGDFHSFYNAEKVLVDDPALRSARLGLLLATRTVLSRGLGLLGVSAPQRM